MARAQPQRTAGLDASGGARAGEGPGNRNHAVRVTSFSTALECSKHTLNSNPVYAVSHVGKRQVQSCCQRRHIVLAWEEAMRLSEADELGQCAQVLKSRTCSCLWTSPSVSLAPVSCRFKNAIEPAVARVHRRSTLNAADRADPDAAGFR